MLILPYYSYLGTTAELGGELPLKITVTTGTTMSPPSTTLLPIPSTTPLQSSTGREG